MVPSAGIGLEMLAIQYHSCAGRLTSAENKKKLIILKNWSSKWLHIKQSEWDPVAAQFCPPDRMLDTVSLAKTSQLGFYFDSCVRVCCGLDASLSSWAVYLPGKWVWVSDDTSPSLLRARTFPLLLSSFLDAGKWSFFLFFSVKKLNSNMSPPSRRLQTKPVITCLKTFLISYSLIFWVSRRTCKREGE